MLCNIIYLLLAMLVNSFFLPLHAMKRCEDHSDSEGTPSKKIKLALSSERLASLIEAYEKNNLLEFQNIAITFTKNCNAKITSETYEGATPLLLASLMFRNYFCTNIAEENKDAVISLGNLIVEMINNNNTIDVNAALLNGPDKGKTLLWLFASNYEMLTGPRLHDLDFPDIFEWLFTFNPDADLDAAPAYDSNDTVFWNLLVQAEYDQAHVALLIEKIIESKKIPRLTCPKHDDQSTYCLILQYFDPALAIRIIELYPKATLEDISDADTTELSDLDKPGIYTDALIAIYVLRGFEFDPFVIEQCNLKDRFCDMRRRVSMLFDRIYIAFHSNTEKHSLKQFFDAKKAPREILLMLSCEAIRQEFEGLACIQNDALAKYIILEMFKRDIFGIQKVWEF